LVRTGVGAGRPVREKAGKDREKHNVLGVTPRFEDPMGGGVEKKKKKWVGRHDDGKRTEPAGNGHRAGERGKKKKKSSPTDVEGGWEVFPEEG